jgi:CheY-like chemotaxis protein
LSFAVPAHSLLKRKKVLLVDASRAKRDLRAEVMRKLGIDVDCAADIPEARSWWKADLYDLVLINAAKELGHRDQFCEVMRNATPPQLVAFLVGQPEYLSASASADEDSALFQDFYPHDADVVARLTSDHAKDPQRWGILEASRRISSVRAESHARTRAMRERPDPPRDLEGWREGRSSAPIIPDSTQN